MSNYFIDSSGLVKRYMPETGTAWVRSLMAPGSDHTIFIAQITIVEVISAIARQYHNKEIDLVTLEAFRRLAVHHTQRQYKVLTLNNEIITRALNLHEKHRLRAYDSVQLASALEVSKRASAIGETITFIAADTRLLDAAEIEGLTTDNPNNYP